MVRREHILAEIRRTAEENGGKPLGRKRFAAHTGISQGDVFRYWARFGDAVREAGFEPNLLQGPRDQQEVLSRLADVTRTLGRMPTWQELALRRREDPSFPSRGVFERLGSKRDLASKIAEWCRSQSDSGDVLELVQPLLQEQEEPEEDESAARAEEAFGFVYLLKSGRYYKLGRTNSVGRRTYELAIQLPERVSQVHVIRTDDPAGIEAYWHRRFAERRRNGEWFQLSPADLRAFKRRKFM
ncbi:MAG: GIY-YIG nuclease family protein [Actinomycetota bacterium]